jgi:hypothetical protein
VYHEPLVADCYRAVGDPEPFWIGPAEGVAALPSSIRGHDAARRTSASPPAEGGADELETGVTVVFDDDERGRTGSPAVRQEEVLATGVLRELQPAVADAVLERVAVETFHVDAGDVEGDV